MRAVLLSLSVAFALALAADFPTVQPKDFADQLAKGSKPAIFQVGPNVLYRSKHIPGAIYAGPGSKPEGLEILRSSVAKLPRSQEIVIYCGCCPWEKCPNIKPAIDLLKSMGFAHVTAMHVATSFKTDWIDAGYPVEGNTAN
jgi:thiosulfate/3-mercaptopyruvate sulfurtransferase